jgi:hypothetical protein
MKRQSTTNEHLSTLSVGCMEMGETHVEQQALSVSHIVNYSKTLISIKGNIQESMAVPVPKSNFTSFKSRLKHNTEQTAANIDPKTFRNVARNTLKRVDACLRKGGGHFQHLL